MTKNQAKFGAKQTAINMITQIVSFVINILIGFFLTPYIVKHLGEEANGFVGLSANFISYATLITTAINSMAGRFIAVSYFKGDTENVFKYYSSVMIANIFLCFILTVPMVFIILFLPQIINVSDTLVKDVTGLFILVFSHFLVDLLDKVFINSAYVLNRLDLVAIRKTEATIIKGILSFAIFAIFIPRVWYVGLIQLICSFYNLFRNVQIHKRLMPEVKVNRKFFDISKIWELLSSGIWNTVSSAGSVLISGLDLLIVNLTVSGVAMGIVSIAKQIPTYVQSLIVTLANVFSPKQTKLFAEGDKKGMEKTLDYSTKITAMITCLPVAFMIVYGTNFFGLWVSGQDSNVLGKIATASVVFFPLLLTVSPFSAIFSATNKVRINSLVTIGVALISLGTSFVLLYYAKDDLTKMIIVVGCSMLFQTLQSLFFTIPYCSKLVGCKVGKFYFTLFRSLIAVGLTSIICFFISKYFIANTWIKIIVSGMITCIIGVVVSFVIILGKEDKKTVLQTAKKFIDKVFRKKEKENV